MHSRSKTQRSKKFVHHDKAERSFESELNRRKGDESFNYFGDDLAFPLLLKLDLGLSTGEERFAANLGESRADLTDFLESIEELIGERLVFGVGGSSLLRPGSPGEPDLPTIVLFLG